MSLIHETKTHAEKLEDHVRRMKKRLRKLYAYIDRNHLGIFTDTWGDPDTEPEFTPQEIMTAFGTDAGDLVTGSLNIQTLLKAVNDDYVAITAPNDYTKNADGTVTIGEERT